MAKDIGGEEKVCEEEQGVERVDEQGNRWRKLYSGGGDHFQRWLQQCKEIYGEENIKIEEADPDGLKCFEEGGEKFYRIWARVREEDDVK